MQNPGNLMVPRCVQSKKTNVPGYNNHRRKENKRKSTSTHYGNDHLRQHGDFPSGGNDTVHAILTEMVNQSCQVMAESLLHSRNTLTLNAAPKSVAETIQMQNHAPYVYVGPITHSNRVPVYQRNRQQIPSTRSVDHNMYTGLNWNPAVSRHKGNQKFGNRNDSKL